MKNVLLIGAGQMAIDYANVLIDLDIDFVTIGRSEQKAKKFFEKTGRKVVCGGLEAFLKTYQSPIDFAIIATGSEALFNSLLLLAEYETKNILVEKPAAISIEELIKYRSHDISSNVSVAYNRRFYKSVIEAQKIIQEDGGLRSMHFEFTEWSHQIQNIQKPPFVKENWFFANSTHVVDTAFFLSGKPLKDNWCSFSKKGTLNWHEISFFAGAGITESGALFTYNSNWESAGRWGIELLTDKRKLILRPLEKLQQQLRGTLEIETVDLDYTIDTDFKPGLYLQVQAFLQNQKTKLLSLEDHMFNSENIYKLILDSNKL